MFSTIKLIIIAAISLSASAFVSQGARPAWRSIPMHHVEVQTSTTTTLHMAVAAPAPVKKDQKQAVDENDTDEQDAKDRGWLVRLYNDPMNKREFVARCLTEICSLDDGEAYNVMMKAHQVGIAVIGNYHQEMAELYKMRLSGEGLLIDMVPADDEE
ncbi:hypothetical protein QTG54_001056 [Skeletonema marinoi]|uniref:Adaptor protein ClpS core domain-containing protein n=1 Tax=Skeletonema marinoi TaxID=267567 RepID=A0AAD8YN53_9STRA|nr:hypothetical protein QTG54_001056 [Skeletonema marinoi]